MAQSIKRRRASGSGGRRKSRLGLWTTIVLLLLAGAYLGVLELSRPHVDGDRLTFTEFVNAVLADRVDNALILEEDEYVTGTYERPDGTKAEYNAPLFRELKRDVVLGYLVPGEVDTEIDQQVGKRVAALAAFLLPGIIIVVLFGYLILSGRRGTGLFAIRSGARKVRTDNSRVRFSDVAGQDAAVGELKEIAEFLTDPARFTALGAAVPKGVLLFGPPGCGKTMLARALAGEARASFFSISGSDFVELYVGVGASRVRDLFREARENAPSLIFIDELDSIGRARGVAGANEGNQEHEQALNQVLAEMDGFKPSEGIIVVAATNRPDILDPALLRPGRFDRTVGLEKPDEEARLAILNIHARNKAIGEGVDLARVASRAHGMSGADLASVMNEAALLAGRAGRSVIGQPELDQALSRVQEAPERQRRLSLRTQTIARRFTGADKVGFGDIAGQDKAVEELAEIREFLADPERFTSLGATIPKGVLLYGPPGCGKTLLAQALASESGAAFLSVSASEFVERYVGGGASRVRDLFAEARSMPPAIIFLDEIDGIGRSRAGMAGTALMGGEAEQTLTQVLSEMDGFETRYGLIVVGATNRPDVLDPALLRPGRFDRTIGLELPDNKGRLAILELHARGKVMGVDTDLEGLANKAYGLTGADLAGIMNEAALLAGRHEREAVLQADLDAALARVMEAPDRQRRLSLRGRNVGRRYSGAERVTFADVAGVDDAVTELAEVKQFLTEPSRFTDMGARVPRGILLTGPPGCGKTLLAKAVAGEANAAFFSVAATEFVEVWVGEGAARVRDLFADARSMAPSIVFIDEIDGVGGRRGSWDGHKERENTLNQLLVELDGFDGRHAVIVMAATNRPDMLDSALTRPGRFDRQVSIRMPDRAGRRSILELYARGKRLASDVDLDAVAGLTTGMSGADLENIMNEAILFATRNHRLEIDQAAIEEGIDRAVLGIGSRATLLTDEERRIVAYHEVGHALVAMSLPDATPPHKITIIPRGGTLGRCQIVDDHDRTVISYSRLLDDMASYLGGWVAERLVFGQVGVGSANDLEQVGRMARQMVKTYGMSDLMGPLGYPDQWSGQGATRPTYSEDSARSIDEEVRRLVDEATRRAEEVLTTKRPALDRLAEALVEKETLTADELGELSGSVRRVGRAKAGAAGGKPLGSSTARRRTTRT